MDVAEELKASGLDAICFSREALDVSDKEAVLKSVTEAAPVAVINCSAYTKVDLAEKEQERAFAVNEKGARNLALACHRNNAVFIHISTDFVFNGEKTAPYTEEDNTEPLGIYGKSKLAGEEAVKALCPANIIIRTSWLYGVHGGNFVKTILRLAGEKEVLRIVSDQRGSPTWTADLAEVITRMVMVIKEAKAPFGLYHYSDEGAASWFEFAIAVVEEARKLGKTLKCKRVEPISTAAYPTPAARPAYSVLDTTKIKDTLRLAIPEWRCSLTKMLTELSRQGRL